MEDKTPLTAEEMIENFKRWFQQFMGGYAEIAITDYKNVVAAEVAQQTASLQERVKELEEENTLLADAGAELMEDRPKLLSEILKLKRDKEKLMGLLEAAKKEQFEENPLVTTTEQLEAMWQSFLKEHGLTE